MEKESLIKFSHWCIDRIEKIFNHSNSKKQVKDFILKKYSWATDCLVKNSELNKAEIAHDLWQIYEKMFALGWGNTRENPFNAYCNKKQISTAEYLTWKSGLWDGKVIRAGVVKAGTGFYLEYSEHKEENNQDSFLGDNLESLLKHVETKREHCLENFELISDGNSIWLERLNIDLLFTRTARLKKDPRFLNAALKLNDWYISYFQRKETLPEMIRFLLALVEQELVFKELYP
jgi:hypothetical protein